MSGVEDFTANLLQLIESNPKLRLFMDFVVQIIQLFGHIDETGSPTTPQRINIPDPQPGEYMPAYLRMAWNARANGWMAF